MVITSCLTTGSLETVVKLQMCQCVWPSGESGWSVRVSLDQLHADELCVGMCSTRGSRVIVSR